jgi:hypothetical protein
MSESLPAETASPWRRLLFGPNGVRTGWRLLAFLAIFYLLTGARNAVVRRVGGLDGAALYVFGQATRFLFCLIAAGLSNREIAGRLSWRGRSNSLLQILTARRPQRTLALMGPPASSISGRSACRAPTPWKYSAAYVDCLIIGLWRFFTAAAYSSPPRRGSGSGLRRSC